MPDRSADHASPAPSAARRATGIVLLVLGIVLLLMSGTCTIGMLVISSEQGVLELIQSGALGIVLGVGGPFILLGALMLWGGARLRRSPAPAGRKHD